MRARKSVPKMAIRDKKAKKRYAMIKRKDNSVRMADYKMPSKMKRTSAGCRKT